MSAETKQQVIERLAADPKLVEKIQSQQNINFGGFKSLEILNAIAQIRQDISDLIFVLTWGVDDFL